MGGENETEEGKSLASLTLSRFYQYRREFSLWLHLDHHRNQRILCRGIMGKGGAYDGSLANRLSALAINGRSDSASTNLSNPSNQENDDDAIIKFHKHEQEIMQLRKLLAEYSVKESQMLREKYVLEKRIALMRLAFDQQQQDLVDAASKAISYRQDIIEENIRLTYALQSAQEETSMFISTLMPLLAEFSLHPPVADAQSIVGNLRILLTHFQEKLSFAEARLRESRYQLPPWHSDVNSSNVAQSHRMDDPDTEKQQNERALLNSSPDPNTIQANYTEPPKNVDLAVSGQKSNESFVNPPYLPSILEEPSLSIPEPDEGEYEDEDEDENGYDSVPAIEGLQILGEAFPGRELQASGYSTNGTTHCGFEWVRHLEDGSVNYIDGAKHPTYIVTADDVDTYLAVEVQPLDDKQRKGELVKCFANSNRKISCDPEMRHHIERTLNDGQASYKLSLWTGSQDTWEPATLEIKTEGYTIKTGGINTVIVTEKFSPATVVNIPCEILIEFSIIGFGGVERYLRTESSSTDISCSRDTIVLTLRLFIKRAVERKKGKKKRVLFFTK